MPMLSNVEPRRAWSRTRRSDIDRELQQELDEAAGWIEDLETFQIGAPRCAACGQTSQLRFDLGTPFCRECLDWSRADSLDEDYDDLGVID